MSLEIRRQEGAMIIYISDINRILLEKIEKIEFVGILYMHDMNDELA